MRALPFQTADGSLKLFEAPVVVLELLADEQPPEEDQSGDREQDEDG
jgi:hypothetical protein